MSVPVALLGGSFRTGGAERTLLELLRRLDRRRFDPRMLYLEREGELLPEYERTGVPLSPLGFSRLREPGACAAVARTRSRLRDDGVRILHAFGLYASLYAAVVARGQPGLALVCRELSSAPPRLVRERIYRRWYHRRASAIVCTSDAVVRQVRGMWGAPEARFVRIYNGVDTDRFTPNAPAAVIKGIPDGVPVVGSIGRLHPVKGHEFLIEAWPLVARRFPDAWLVLVGGGHPDRRRALEEAARATGHGGSVRFLGLRDDVPSLLARMDLVVQPSLAEGFSHALLEAGASARPVVATRVGGNEEAIVDGETGLLTPPRDPGALAAGIVDLLGDPARARRMGDAARVRVARSFTLERMVAAHEELYAGLVS